MICRENRGPNRTCDFSQRACSLPMRFHKMCHSTIGAWFVTKYRSRISTLKWLKGDGVFLAHAVAADQMIQILILFWTAAIAAILDTSGFIGGRVVPYCSLWDHQERREVKEDSIKVITIGTHNGLHSRATLIPLARGQATPPHPSPLLETKK